MSIDNSVEYMKILSKWKRQLLKMRANENKKNKGFLKNYLLNFVESWV